MTFKSFGILFLSLVYSAMSQSTIVKLKYWYYYILRLSSVFLYLFHDFLCSPSPVHGDYSPWQRLHECSRSCGGGTEHFIRYCDNPRPAHGGKNCSRLGPAEKSQSCNTQKCPGKLLLCGWNIYKSLSIYITQREIYTVILQLIWIQFVFFQMFYHIIK